MAMAARIPMMMITTNSSIRVKPSSCVELFFIMGRCIDHTTPNHEVSGQKITPKPVNL
jgi:hypothetical protein